MTEGTPDPQLIEFMVDPELWRAMNMLDGVWQTRHHATITRLESAGEWLAPTLLPTPGQWLARWIRARRLVDVAESTSDPAAQWLHLNLDALTQEFAANLHPDAKPGPDRWRI